MATIFNTIKKADGAAQANASVEVTLTWDTSVSTIARNEDDDFTIQGTYSTLTSQSGFWEVEVTDNDSISPPDSVYKIVETLKSGESNTYYVSVPANATPSDIWVGDILAATPSWES